MKRSLLRLGLGITLFIFAAALIYGVFLGEKTPETTEGLFDTEKLRENEKLLLQEADKQEITVSDEEIDELLKATGQTERELSSLLEEKDTSLKDFKEEIREDIKLMKLLEEELKLSEVEVSDEELEEFLGIEDSVRDDDPLISTVKEEARKRMVMIKQSMMIEEYLRGLEEDE